MQEIMNSLKNQGYTPQLFGELILFENKNHKYAIENMRLKKLGLFGRELSLPLDAHGIQNMCLTLIRLEGLGRFRR